MQVYCSLPLDSTKPRLLRGLANRDIHAVFTLYDEGDLDKLVKLVDLSQISFDLITIRLSYCLYSSNRPFAEKCIQSGICNFLFIKWLGHDIANFPSGCPDKSSSFGFEILNSSEIHELHLASVSFDFLVLKGHEAGGVVGGEHIHLLYHSSYRLLRNTDTRILIEGGIGIKGSAALSLMGANGVVLDNQLRLANDYPYGTVSIPRIIGAHETISFQVSEEYSLRVPRTFGKGIQQQVESKIANCYPLQSVKDTPFLIDTLLAKFDIESDLLETVCLGQDFGFAKKYADTYNGILDIALAYRNEVKQTINDLNYLLESNTVSDCNFTSDYDLKYDLMQGPMTRVSDTPEFIKAVSDGGALPFFAAAMIRPEVLKDKLSQTKELLGSQPWGVGLLGFLPRDIRTAQFDVIKQIQPPFVLIAGGRPDQVDEFESHGIKAFIHAPTLELFQQYIAEGATNLILEGRECGGHVGPVGSLVLWEQCVEHLLLSKLPKSVESYHIIFAGGIADAATCATARILSSKPKALGIRVGILTGTPYLYTDEAVSSGAIIESYRDTVIDASNTINLETGAGHASRCAFTPFANEFQVLKEKYITEGLSGFKLREELEKLTLGRLRLATKGIKRDSSGLVSVSQEESYRDGMYMLGQSASLLGEKTNIDELHERLTSKTFEYIASLSKNETQNVLNSNYCGKVAIVSMDCMMPDSPDIHRFWEILASGQDVVKETPVERWDPDLYYSSDKSDSDRVYSKWGGFLPPIDIDPIKLGIPPVSLKKIEPLQILTLELVTRLFEYNSIDFSQDVRDRTAIFLGAGGGIGDMGGKYAARAEIERITQSSKSEMYSRLPEWGDETFPGLLFNVVAGRVANRLNLRGASYTVDAACASSLAAIYSAYRELTSGNCDLAIAGGVDTGQSPFAFLCFSRSQALSPTGRSKSFDQDADGIAISEGLGIVVMKRLDDAVLAGDDVIAVIDGVGAASDGRGSSLTSPQTSGQQLAVERAWASAHLSPSYMSLYEAHGTGTIAGDHTELETLLSITRRNNSLPQSCAVSSTKPNIGHTKSSAGIAGLMHAALCLHHRVLSPQIGGTNPLPELQDPSSPIFLNKKQCFWPTTINGRKAGVSAFGFGGTNYHIVLSEPPIAPRFKHSWPNTTFSLFTWHALDEVKLKKQISEFHTFIQEHPNLSLSDLSLHHNRTRDVGGIVQNSPYRAALVSNSIPNLVSRLNLILQGSFVPDVSIQNLDIGTWISCLSLDHALAPVVLSFPGQGGLREYCLDELLLSTESVKDSLDQAIKAKSISTETLRQLFNNRSSDVVSTQDFSSYSMADLQPLISSIQLGLSDMLVNSGLTPDIVIGHSLGELTATAFAGMWNDRCHFLEMMKYRGQVMDDACQSAPSGMLATSLTDIDKLKSLLSRYNNLYLSNFNSPSQTTISGQLSDLESIANDIRAIGAKVSMLNVSGGFHSPLMSQAADAFKSKISNLDIRQPSTNVLSMVDGQFYSADCHSSVDRLSRHMTASVDLVNGLSALSSEPHIFVNIGPSLTMQKLIRQNRVVDDDIFISLDDGSNEIDGLLNALANLFCLVPNFSPNFGCDLPPHVRKNSPFDVNRRSATVSNGMAHMLNDVAHPSASPPLTFIDKGHVPPNISFDPSVLEQNQQPLSSSTQTPLDNIMSHTMSTHHSFSNTTIKPMVTDTSLQIFSLYSENVRQMLASQERVAIALLTQNSQLVFNDAPPSNSQSLSASETSSQLNDLVDNQSLINLNFDFLNSQSEDKTVQSSALSVGLPDSVGSVSAQSSDTNKSTISSHTSQLVPPSSLDQGSVPSPDMSSLLLEITSELTGYPQDMLDPSLALEADLGIDSIKRVEIFARLQKTVPSEIKELIISRRDDLAEAPTIKDIINVLSSLVGSSGK